MAGKPLTTIISSAEVNYLVFRYLQECGYVHSAYVFGHESQVLKTNIDGSQIPPGALASFVQRGVNFVELEDSLIRTDTEGRNSNAVNGTTSLLEVHKALTRDRVLAPNSCSTLTGNLRDFAENDPDGTNTVAYPERHVMIMQGHTSEVFCCAWNPQSSVLATGSADSTARLWPVPSTSSGPCSAAAAAASQPLVLLHEAEGGTRGRTSEVTTLAWNTTGTKLACGTFDGTAHVWKENGRLLRKLKIHRGALFSVKWSEDSSKLLTCSADSTVALWDAEAGDLMKHFKSHDKSVLDIDWRDDYIFASCSADSTICVYSVNKENPIRMYKGHQGEVNCIRWSPSKSLIASCSDDKSAKIWGSNSSLCVYDLREHRDSIYTLRWSPNLNSGELLATASFDALVKLWDASTGKCVQSLAGHSEPIISVDFSPDGKYLVSGSSDQSLNIWNVNDGSMIKSLKGSGGIFEVSWNEAGDKIAAAYANNCVSVLDLRSAPL